MPVRMGRRRRVCVVSITVIDHLDDSLLQTMVRRDESQKENGGKVNMRLQTRVSIPGGVTAAVWINVFILALSCQQNWHGAAPTDALAL